MRNLGHAVAVLTVALSTGCPLIGPKDGTPGTSGAGDETGPKDPEPVAKSETGGAETGGAASSTCQDELDRAVAEATAKFDECKAGAN